MNGKSRENMGAAEGQREIEVSKEIEKIYELLLESTSDSIYALDRKWRCILANSATERITGMPKEKLLGKKITEIFPGIEKTKIFESFKRVMEKGKSEVVCEEYVFKDNRRGWYEVRVYPSPRGILCILRDITEQKKAEEKLVESENKLRTLLDATHDMVLLLEWDATIIDMNDSMAKSLGVNKNEVIGKNLRNYLPPEIFESRYNCAVKTKKTGKPAGLIDERAGKYLDNIFYPIFDENGEVFRLAVFSRDITEQKKAEEKLVENQRKLHALIDATHDLVLLANVDGTILDLNESMATSLGGEKDDVIGTNIKEHLPPAVYESRTARVRNIQRTKKPERFIDTKRGRWYDNHFYPIFDEKGEVIQIAVFTRDITERKVVEEALKESEERFRTVVENAGEGIGIVDDKEEFIFANPAAEEIFGMGAGGLAGRNLMEFLSHEEKKKVSRQTEKRRKGENGTYELEIVRPDGRKRIIEVTVSPRFDSDGFYKGAFGVFRDITEHREMERQLIEREEMYRKLVETLPDAVTMTDLEGNVTYASKRTLELHGFESEDDILGMNSLNLIAPEEHEKAMENIRKTLETGFVRNVEYTMLRKDGSRFTGFLSASTVMDADGNPEGFIGITRDITDRKKAEDKVRHLSQFRESIIENANVWLDVLDEKGNVVIWNRAAENISGYSAGEVVGHGKIWEWLYPDKDYRRRITEKAAAIIERGEVVEDFETTIRCKNGDIKVISWNSRNLLGNDGKPVGSVALGRDMTARRRAEEELMRFKTAADNASYGVAIADVEGMVLYCNEYYASVHGYRVDEVVGKSMSLFYSDEQLEEVTKLRKMMFEGKTAGVGEVWHTHRDGSTFPMMMSGAVIRDREGKPEYLAVNALDITEYKQMEQKILQEDKMAALGRITSVVSHELNTPLANIAVTAEYLSSKLSNECDEELKIILSEVDNASDIIKRILNFSRMDSFEIREVDIGEVIERAAEAVRVKRGTDTIEMELGKCKVMGDEYRLFEVMVNILDNAVLARDSLKEKHTVKVKSRASDGSAIITVTDNGVGMNTSVLEKSSQPFFTTRARGEGAGLGLFIAKRIVEEHGGKLSVESEKDTGTMVTVTIPCAGGGK